MVKEAMKPVEILSEKVNALQQALFYLKSCEVWNPVAARRGAEAILKDLHRLSLKKSS